MTWHLSRFQDSSLVSRNPHSDWNLGFDKIVLTRYLASFLQVSQDLLLPLFCYHLDGAHDEDNKHNHHSRLKPTKKSWCRPWDIKEIVYL